MVPAEKLHDAAQCDALRAYDPYGSALDGHWHLFWSLLRVTLNSFGAPMRLFENMSIHIKDGRDFWQTLRTLEGMMRRILLIMAGQDMRPLDPFKSRKTPQRPDAVATGAARKTWRPHYPASLPARLVFVPPAPSGAKKKAAKRAAPGRDLIWTNAHPMASRLEALIRAYQNPEPYVMKLRQKLAIRAGAAFACARMLAEPARLLPNYPHFVAALRELEPDAKAGAGAVLKRPSG